MRDERHGTIRRKIHGVIRDLWKIRVSKGGGGVVSAC